MKKHSVRPQDKPQTKIRIAARRTRLMKLFAEGKSTREAAKVLQAEGHEFASKAIVARDLQALAAQAPAKWETARAEAHVELKALNKFVAESDMSDSDTVHGLLAIHDRIARLLGLDAPAKSIGVRLNAEVDPATMGLYQRFLHESEGIRDFEPVWAFMRSLPRERASAEPPDDAESWNDEVKELNQ